jgi:HSP20 family molecular chaperone IbpA
MVTTQALTNIFDHFDRNLLTPYAVGFDRVFDRLNTYVVNQNHMTSGGFPPYNIRTEGDYNYVIEMALAGLSKDDLEVQLRLN